MAKTKKDERLLLIDSLSELQKTHKAIVDKYSVATRARLSDLLDSLRGRNPEEGRPVTMKPAKAKEMLDEIREVRLKPEKGRGKDLYRIEKLLTELEEIYLGK